MITLYCPILKVWIWFSSVEISQTYKACLLDFNVILGTAVAQEVEWVICLSEGWLFNPRLLQSVCRSGLWQNTEPQIFCAIGVWMSSWWAGCHCIEKPPCCYCVDLCRKTLWVVKRGTPKSEYTISLVCCRDLTPIQLLMLSAKQGDIKYHFYGLWSGHGSNPNLPFSWLTLYSQG